MMNSNGEKSPMNKDAASEEMSDVYSPPTDDSQDGGDWTEGHHGIGNITSEEMQGSSRDAPNRKQSGNGGSSMGVMPSLDETSCDCGSESKGNVAGNGSDDEGGVTQPPSGVVLKPPDGGWGWLVALGGFINVAFSHMIGTCFAIIFSRFLLDLETSSTTVAWIYNLQSSIFNIVGLMAGPLTQEFGWRRVTFVGALFESSSLIISAFAPSAGVLFFSYGILAGIGSGATVCISMLIVPRFFEKRRGRANSILMAGFCIGQMTGPPLSRYLQDEYGFIGGTLLVGAILLNGCVAASLFQPLEWHMKEVKSNLEDNDIEKPLIKQGDLSKLSKDSTENYSTDTDGHDGEMMSKGRRRHHQRKNSQSSPSSSSSCEDPTKDNLHLARAPVQEELERASDKKSNRGMPFTIFKVFGNVINATKTNLRILRSPSALIIGLGNTLFINAYINFIMMVPFAMQAAGHSLESSAWCISVSGICNLLSRIVANSLSDFPWFSIKLFYMVGLVMVALCSIIFPLVSDLQWLMVIMGVWGCGIGATMGVYSLIMIDVVGMENMAACFGATCLLIATGYITLGPLMGYVRDISSSYAVSMWVSASLTSLSFIFWLFLPTAMAYDRRKGRENKMADRRNP